MIVAALFIITKLFTYFYNQLVFVNFTLSGQVSFIRRKHMDIGLKLKELRVLKGLTQEELADRSELSKGFISQLERNLTSPSIATLTDILQCLGTTLGEFFNESPDEQIVLGRADYLEK